MLQFLFGLFILLHGLVHLWYFTLSQRLVEFQAEMGWTGESWVLSQVLEQSAVRPLAGSLFILAAAGFVLSSIGVFLRAAWWPAALVISAVFSSIVVLLFWDGQTQMLVQKGLLGLVINLVLLVVLLVF